MRRPVLKMSFTQHRSIPHHRRGAQSGVRPRSRSHDWQDHIGTQQGYIGTAGIRMTNLAIGGAVIILTSSSKQFRWTESRFLKSLKAWFVLCGSKVVVTLITRKLPN